MSSLNDDMRKFLQDRPRGWASSGEESLQRARKRLEERRNPPIPGNEAEFRARMRAAPDSYTLAAFPFFPRGSGFVLDTDSLWKAVKKGFYPPPPLVGD